MNAKPTLFLLLGLLAVAGCGSQADKESGATELPGFEITLPSGSVRKSTSHPGVGSHHLDYGINWRALLPDALARELPAQNGSVKVSWRAGAMRAEDLIEERRMMGSLMNGIASNAQRSIRIDEYRWIDTLAIEGQWVNMGYAYCAPGLLITVVHGSKRPIEEQTAATQRMVESVVCKVGDSVPALPDPNLNLSADFGRTVSSDSAMYISLSGTLVAASQSHNDLHVQREVLRQILQNVAQESFQLDYAPALTMNELKRSDSATALLGEFVMPGAEQRAFFATLYCREVDFTILSFITGPTIDAETAGGIAERMDCSFAPKNVRSVSELFGEACDAGQAGACRDLSLLVEEGTALADHGTAVELRAKACAFGDAGSCAD